MFEKEKLQQQERIKNFYGNFFRSDLLQTQKLFSKYSFIDKLLRTNLFFLQTIFFFTFFIVASFSYYKNSEEITKFSSFLESTYKSRECNLSRLSELESLASTNWYNYLYSFRTTKNQIELSITREIAKYLRTVIMPEMYNIVEGNLKEGLKTGDLNSLILHLKIYSMFHGLEEFDRPFFESYYLDQFLSDRLKLDSLGYVIDNISSDLFLLPKFKLDRQLYNKAITELNSSVTEKMFYTTIINALNDRLDFSPISNSLMSLRNLFDEELGNLSIPYIYSKEGYKEYISRNTGLLGKISSLAYHNQNLNLTRIKKSSDRAFSTYCNDYISYYKGLLSVIKFKKIYTIDEAISLLKCISNNSHIISNIFQQIDDVVIPNVKYRSIASDVSIIAANVPQTKLLNKEDLISEQMNNYFDEDMATNTLTPELKASLAKNIQELIDLFAKLSVAKDINESCFHEVVRLEKADSDSPLKQARETIALLSFPFDKLYRDLIINLESILYENAVNHINEQWGNLYPSLSQKIIQLYPFNIDNFLTQVSEKDFTSFFGKEGELNNFSDKYLGLEAISISDQGKYLIEFSKSVSSHWFNEDGKLQLKFTIIPLRLDPDIKEVTLLIAGNEFKFTHDHLDPCVVMWPDTKHNSNYSKIEFISNKGHHYGESFIGEWSWYKLLELDQKHTGDSNITFIGTSTNIIHSSLGEFEFELQFSQNTPLLDITKLQLVNYITHNPKK